MSELSVGQLKGLLANSNVITVPSGHTLYAPGSVVQVQTIRSDSRTTISSPTSGNGTTITQLNLAITPKFASSKLIMQWMINGEMNENNVILVHKDGSLITNSGETAYNSEAGNSRWSGVASAIYDADVASTIENYFVQYFCNAGSISPQVFAPAVRASGGTAHTFFLNRTANGSLADNQESTISTGIIWEIAQ